MLSSLPLPLSLSLSPSRSLRYEKFYHKVDAVAFARDFFADEDVVATVVAPHVGLQGKTTLAVTGFNAKPLKTSVTTMAFFDKMLERRDVFRDNGLIVKCMDDYHQGFHVQVRERSSHSSLSPLLFCLWGLRQRACVCVCLRFSFCS